MRVVGVRKVLVRSAGRVVLGGVLAGTLGGPLTPAARAQSGMGDMAMGAGNSMPMAGMKAVPPPEQLPTPLHMTGIGNAHIQIKGTPEAQVWFDQGLNLMHDFWDYESAKAFEQAVRVDPSCAMCWWGLSRVVGSRSPQEAVYRDQALAEAVRLKGKGSGTDKLYIEAAEIEAKSKDGSSKEATEVYRKLVKKQPHDAEARIFLAESVGDGYDDKGEPKPGKKEQIAILESVLKDFPDDSAANHYWIHAIEPGNHPELAIPSAARLARLAPTSGHMVHMPGHIYFRVGDYADAETWFQASTAADEKYMREQHVDVDDDWNYVHNMMYSIANLMEQGRLADANALSDRLAGARGQLSATLYVWSARDAMARVSFRLPVALRIGDWDGVVALLDHASLGDERKTANLRFLAGELRDFALGMRALEHGDTAAAQAASARMDAGLWRSEQDAGGGMMAMHAKPAAAPAAIDKAKKAEGAPAAAAVMLPTMPDAESGPLMQSLGVASLELRGAVMVAEGKLDAGKKLFADAASREKKLGYHEPPLYIRPVGENEAAALLRAGDFAGAKHAYEEALVERPASGFGLYGLAHVAELEGNQAAAKTQYAAFLKAWPAADAALPEVVHAREEVGSGTVSSR